MDEIKQLLDEQHQAFEAFKQTNDERLNAIEHNGHAPAELEAKVDAINDELTRVSQDLAAVAKKANRPGAGADGPDPVALEHTQALGRYLRKGEDRDLAALQRKVLATYAGGFVDENGEALEVLRRAGDSLWVRLSEVQNILPDAPREYRRLTVEGDQVPIDAEGFALTAAAWGLLEAAERTVRYFRQRQVGDELRLTEVADQAAYEALAPGEQGPIRYFRILQGAGESVPFDTDGDSLTASTYGRLGNAEKGPVVGAGGLLRLRYAAPVFRNGTTVEVAVRNSDGGRDLEQPWQRVEAGDATPMVASNTLSIGLPLGAVVLDQVELSPNPFTPNGDGVNDAVRIGFSVFQISDAREVKVSVYTLDGRRVWETAQMMGSGRGEPVHWTGVDGGRCAGAARPVPLQSGARRGLGGPERDDHRQGRRRRLLTVVAC